MARYIDADQLVERLKVSPIFQDFGTDGYFIRDMVIDLVRCRPTADVVPKSEVVLANSDAVKMLIDCHGYFLTHDADIKEEVARELFEEIESIIRKHDERPKYQLMLDLTELKKKYTEGHNDD